MSKIEFTNTTGIPLSLAVWLSQDSYDHSNDPNHISATTLLKPMREVILARQHKAQPKSGDLISLVSSRMGQALHDSIEQSWINHSKLVKALVALGYPETVASKIIINPTPELLKDNPNSIPVYLERRSSKKVGNFTVSGKFDFVIDGRLEDFKSTGAYSYVMQSNNIKYVQQGSIYRWLNPDIITQDVMAIQYIFTDWNKLESIKNKKYPKSRILEKTFPLIPIKQTESFVQDKINTIERLKDSPQDQLPLCSSEELWIKPTVWKYYKNPNKTDRATKNFDTEHEASERFFKDNSVGVIKKVDGQVVKCKYCSVVDVCDQAKSFIANGQLTL